MTELQYDRWKDFALRMARTCFDDWPGDPRVTPKWIEDCVEEYFENSIQDEFADIEDWDGGPQYLCDDVQRYFLEQFDYGERWRLASAYEYDLAMSFRSEDDWDSYDAMCVHIDEEAINPVQCCIRAGIDVAVHPSAGVIGFTVCDLRKMYPEGIPDWINSGFEDKDGQPVDLNAGACNVPIWL